MADVELDRSEFNARLTLNYKLAEIATMEKSGQAITKQIDLFEKMMGESSRIKTLIEGMRIVVAGIEDQISERKEQLEVWKKESGMTNISNPYWTSP